MADKIIKLKLDTSSGDASIKASEALLKKLKEQIAALEAQLAKVNPKPIEDLESAVTSAVDSAKDPIKLDVNADKEKIDALIASLGNAKKEAAALEALNPVINVNTNADQVADELKSIDLTGAEVPVVVEAVGLDAVKEDIASVSADVTPAEVPVVPVDIDSARAEIASVADDVPAAEVPVQPVGIDSAKDEIASISDGVPPATVGVVSSGIEQVQEEISNVALDAPIAEIKVEPVDMEVARDAIASVAQDVPTAIIPVEASGVEAIKNELDIDAKEVEVPVVAVGVDKAQDDISSIDSAHDVAVKVTTNIPEVQPEVDKFKKDLEDLSFEQKVELAIDASKAAATINDVKKSQKELQNLLLQSQEGSETFNRLSAAAGESKDKVDDIREAISKLSKSPIENLSGGFKSVKQSLLDLNFAQFNKDVNALGVASKKVSFKELASSVGETGKSFLSLGKIILANPIGILVTIVTLIITNFDKLKSTLTGLAPVFEFIGDIIGAFVDTLKDLGDAMGLTSFAADEASAAALESSKKNFEALKKEGDRAVALAKARGEDTTTIELKNLREQQANREAALSEYDSIVRRKGELTDDEKEQQQELIDSNEELGISIEQLNIKREKDLATFAKAAAESKLNATELRELRVKEAKAEVDQTAEVLKKGIADRVKAEQDAVKLANAQVLTAPIEKQQELQKKLVEIEQRGAKEIESIESDSASQKSKIQRDADKAALDSVRTTLDQKKKLLQEEADFQNLLQAKANTATDDVVSLRNTLEINKELQKIEETRLQRKTAAGKLTAEESIKEKTAIVDRYDSENKALTKTIELRRTLSSIDVELTLDSLVFDKKLSDAKENIQSLQQESIDIEARISFDGASDELLAEQKRVHDELIKSQSEFEDLSLQLSKDTLQSKTELLLTEQKRQEEIIKTGLDLQGREITPEERSAAVERLAAIDKQVEKNQNIIKALNEIDEVSSRSSEQQISASDRLVISEVNRIEKLKEEGKAVSDLEQAFLDANKSAEIDIRIKTDKAALDELKKNLDQLQLAFDKLVFEGASQEDIDAAKKRIDSATSAVLDAQEQLQQDLQKQKEENGSPMANALGVSDNELQQLKQQAVDAALETAQLIGDTIIQQDRENIQRQFDAKVQAIEDTNTAEIDRLQERLDKGQITQEQFDKKTAESNKKAAEAKLAAEKAAFEKEKQLKLKQLNIELVLEIGRIWASYAVLPPGASAIGAAIATGAALAQYAVRKGAIQQETFEQGGVIGEGPRSTMNNEPFHGVVQGNRHTEGGEHFKIRGTNRVAELEKDEIVIRRPLAIRDRNKLLAYNAGRIKLFEDGGMVADALGSAAASYVSAAGSNIMLPPSERLGVSPIGFSPEQNSPQVTLHVTDLERVQSGLNRTKKRVTFRS